MLLYSVPYHTNHHLYDVMDLNLNDPLCTDFHFIQLFVQKMIFCWDVLIFCRNKIALVLIELQL